MNSESIVRLNIGGKKFMTSSMTINRLGQNNLSLLVAPQFPVIRDDEGYIFLDRNPYLFEIILDYLRNGIIEEDKLKNNLEKLKVEFDFYKISCPYFGKEPLTVELDDKSVVTFNVGGKAFSTMYSTIALHPKSLLMTIVQSKDAVRDENGYFFIDRNPKIFSIMLDYLRTNEIQREKLKKYLLPLRKEFTHFGLSCFYFKKKFERDGDRIIVPSFLKIYDTDEFTPYIEEFEKACPDVLKKVSLKNSSSFRLLKLGEKPDYEIPDRKFMMFVEEFWIMKGVHAFPCNYDKLYFFKMKSDFDYFKRKWFNKFPSSNLTTRKRDDNHRTLPSRKTSFVKLNYDVLD